MALIPATLTTASAADGQAPAVPGVTSGEQTTDPQKVRDFWTPERVARALANERNDRVDIAREAAAAEAAAGADGRRPGTLPRS
ncbi:hypothetical protein [Streptomyces sp. JW3]|uniref:hypothetical protein n=1 Tax=Streptomyces sp. JW3 TaxID=3456955 RepID=UPI003FA4739C